MKLGAIASCYNRRRDHADRQRNEARAYEILAPLGAGGMGEVYKARDARLERFVAIKVLLEHLSDDPARRERLERDAKTISQLNHAHIGTLHDAGSDDGIDYLVMEHLEGETLADRLTRGALPLDEALRYAAQMADALVRRHIDVVWFIGI